MTSGPASPATSSPRAGATTLAVALAIPEFPVLRAAYRAILGGQPDIRLVADVESRSEVVPRLAAAAPDVVIAECGGEGGTGCAAIAAVEELRAAVPSAHLLVVDCRCGGEQFATVMRAGADGYLDREAAPDDVLAAVRCVAEGCRYVSPTVVTALVNRYVRQTDPVPADDAYESLGERAREVFRLAATGHTNREIARALHISEQTVHSHRAAIMERLGLHDRIDLVKYALRRGLIEVAEL